MRHYKEITYRDNKARLNLLTEFRDSVNKYFENSNLNMMTGEHVENPEARDARDAINLQLKKAYKIIRLADINPSALSTPHFASGSQGLNLDLILNIFNLGRNEIPPDAAIDYIERAIDVYKSNRPYSFIRTVNPLFWISLLLKKSK